MVGGEEKTLCHKEQKVKTKTIGIKAIDCSTAFYC
jgi:hypothetical protein